MDYHFVGIGGIGMSALARILLDQKIPISGSDVQRSPIIEALERQGASIKLGHSASYVSRRTTVVYSSSVPKTNPEIQAAKALKLPMLHRSELLSSLIASRRGLVVTGTHGKTTVSALLVAVLAEAGIDPSFAIGGMVDGVNGKFGSGEYFVAEGDESDGSFLRTHPFGAIVTNLEKEHMDHFETEEKLYDAFETFFSQVQKEEHLFYCGDDQGLSQLQNKQGIPYGFGAQNALRVIQFEQKGWSIQFDLSWRGKEYRSITTPLAGKHQALNAAAVFGMALSLGIEEETIRRALRHFSGVGRRCEKKGTFREVLLVDDYAHHPTEVAKTLMAIREAIGERRLIVIFQPHRYSRLSAYLHAFAGAFDGADFLYVTAVYAAGEPPLKDISSETLIQAIRKRSTLPVLSLPKEGAVETVGAFLRPHDVCVTLGAGDITGFHDALGTHFLHHPPKKYTVGLIFGGRSPEHEISLKSARCVEPQLNRALYDVRFFGIDKEGNWITGSVAAASLEKGVSLSSEEAHHLLSKEIGSALQQCDLFFPVLHGTNGEDGTIQGFFELLGKPYAGPDFRSAALCMDKGLTKKVVAHDGVISAPFVAFSYREWLKERENLLGEMQEKLRFPLYVKPSHIGSSVGMSKVLQASLLPEAIEKAFRYDTHLIVEEGKEGCREFEFAVIGNGKGSIKAPLPGEKLSGGAFVDYEKKYGKEAVATTVYPELTEAIEKKGRALAECAYASVGCTGMTRVDFLLDPEENFWLIEMNPIPGLQPLSLFPKIWEREGLSPSQLMDRLVILGLARRTQQNRHFARH